MNSEISENVQTAIRPGMEVDTYYYGETNSEKQAYPCIVNNKFKQQFTNLGGGTSQFVISPYQGISDIIGYFKLPAMPGGFAGMLPAGWAYSLIRQVSVRYGSSAQYFFTGEQIRVQNLLDCETGPKRDNLNALGGNAAVGADCSLAAAYFYLNLPHNSPRADGKPLPFPSDLLVQPIVLTIELNPVASIFLPVYDSDAGGTLTAVANAPTSLTDAWIQVKQEMMSDTADLLARREDMNTHAYTFPLKYFAQQEVQVDLGALAQAGGSSFSINLTGWRAGEVQKVLLWLSSSNNDSVYGPGGWPELKNLVLTYNGEIFYRADDNASQMWNLVCDTKEAGYNAAVQDGAGAVDASKLFTYVEVPFAQVNIPYDKEVKLVHGKPILNAVVQLTGTVGESVSIAASTTPRYTLHAVYLYNSSLLCSRGSSEYIF
jgi:hypothetical protein